MTSLASTLPASRDFMGKISNKVWWPVAGFLYVTLKIVSWLFSPFVDFNMFQSWTYQLVSRPISEFYSGYWSTKQLDWAAHIASSDRFPTDGLLFKSWSAILGLFPENEWKDVLANLLQGSVWVFEALCILLLWSIFAKHGVKHAARWASLFAFVPFFAFIANAQLTFEFIPLGLSLAAYRLLLSRKFSAFLGAGVFLGLAALERPQFGILIVVLLALFWYQNRFSVRLISAVLTAGLTVVAVSSLFSLGVFWNGGRGSLLDLFFYNLNFYNTFTRGGANIWSWWPSALTEEFAKAHILGLSVSTVSTSGIIIVGLVGLFLFFKSKQNFDFRILWLGAFVTHVMFFFGLRMIDRYDFIAVFLLFVLVVFYGKQNHATLWSFWLISTISFLNGIVIFLTFVFTPSFVLPGDLYFSILAAGNALVFYPLIRMMFPKKKIASTGPSSIDSL